MQARLPVSVFIIAVDEADRIGRTIASVSGWVDEVIVIDSGSVDGTQKVAADAGARVMFNAWPGYGLQKRFGEDQCRNDWLLNLDADEVITPELKEEIITLFAKGIPDHAGYWMSVVEIMPSEKAPTKRAHRVDCLRLYDRRKGRFSDSTVHDSVHMQEGSAGKFFNIVHHYSSRGIGHSIAKINRYSTMQAENLMAKKQCMPCMPILLALVLPMAFLKAYLLRGYVFKGTRGFINAVVYAFSRFARLAKYWELQQHKRE